VRILRPANTIVNAAHDISADCSAGSSRLPHSWRNRDHRPASWETSPTRGKAAAVCAGVAAPGEEPDLGSDIFSPLSEDDGDTVVAYGDPRCWVT
jgi:hypothetical protein